MEIESMLGAVMQNTQKRFENMPKNQKELQNLSTGIATELQKTTLIQMEFVEHLKEISKLLEDTGNTIRNSGK